MSRKGYRLVGKPVEVPDGNSTLQLHPFLYDDGTVGIQWSAVSTFSPTFEHWKRYKKRSKGFETTREARKFIREFARAEQERVSNASNNSRHEGSGSSRGDP